MVPLRSATTLFGRPALISDCAPMMLRVRPAQLTTTSVSGEGAMSRMRSTSSAPGTLVAVGIETRWNSSNGRLSTTTMSVPLSHQARRAPRREMLGVWQACSMCSPNALLGTLTPENSSKPAFSQAAMPPSQIGQVGVAGGGEDLGGALDQAVAVVAQHDAGVAARHQPREAQLQPAQRHRARPQQMAAREDQLFAQIDQRQLARRRRAWL